MFEVLISTDLQLVNVNVPRLSKGLVWSRASVRRYDGHVVPTKDPMGRDRVLVHGQSE